MPIQKLSLRDQAREELLAWLAAGRLVPGQRLEETRLSQAMGVSRTPLREALAQLAREGLVESVPRRGFRVPRLSAEQARDLWPVAGALEGLALRLSGPQAGMLAPELASLNERLALPHLSPRQRAEADRRWHERLTSRCPNRELMRMLGGLRQRLLPYAGSWARPAGEIDTACAEHAEISRLATQGQLEQAAEALLRHWVREIPVVTRWVENESATDGSPGSRASR